MRLQRPGRRNGSREGGFTLVELLIVVAIIAILAAIAIPQFSAYRKRGYAATINSDLKNAYNAGMGYLIENPNATLDCSSASLPGYLASNGVVTTACNMAINSGSITLAGPTSWGLSQSTATADINGAISFARP